MKYSTPELFVLGSASVLVLGGEEGRYDNVATFMTRPVVGVALGLDD
jgi:hypothetical protein